MSGTKQGLHKIFFNQCFLVFEVDLHGSLLGGPIVGNIYFRILTLKKNSSQSERYLLGIYYMSQALCSTLEYKD